MKNPPTRLAKYDVLVRLTRYFRYGKYPIEEQVNGVAPAMIKKVFGYRWTVLHLLELC